LGTTNILFSDALAVAGPGTLLKGVVNNTTYLYDFQSTTTLVVNNAKGGQAQIEANNGTTFSDMQLYLDDPTLVYDAFVFSLKGTGDVQFTIDGYTSTGTAEHFVAPTTYNLATGNGNGNGQNWFQFTTLNGEQLSKISFTGAVITGVEVGTLDHPRIGDISTLTVTNAPEPASIILLGSVLMGLTIWRRKRTSSI